MPAVEPRRDDRGVVGEVIFRDTFGNLITNVPAPMLEDAPAEAWEVEVAGHRIDGPEPQPTAHHPPGTLVSLVGSSGWLEVALVNGDAAPPPRRRARRHRLVPQAGLTAMAETMTPPPTPATVRRWDRDHLWHPFTAQADWAPASRSIIERAEGAELIDSEGRRYLDGVSSLWCNVHGHRHPTIDAAIRDQLDRVAHYDPARPDPPDRPSSWPAGSSSSPRPGLTRVFFSDDGATAVEVALKMAFQYWRQKAEPEPGRTAVRRPRRGLPRRHARRRQPRRGRPLPRDVPPPAVPGPPGADPVLLPLPARPRSGPIARWPASTRSTACSRAHPGEVAGVVVEPLVQGAAGMVVHPEGYLRGLREITRRHGTLLIADEVAVGFGRTGRMFACEQEGVTPDFLCLAKGITGGYLPLAATLTTEAVYSAFYATASEGKTFQHGHTYGGNPLGAAAALATLRVFEEERTLEAMAPKVALLDRWLARFADLPHVGDVRQRGLMAGIELVADRATKAEFPWQPAGRRPRLPAGPRPRPARSGRSATCSS